MSIDVTNELEAANAVLLNRHFIYKSGKHGSGYINLDPLFTRVGLLSEICGMLTHPFSGEVDTVAAPATGGIVLAMLTGKAFVDQGQNVNTVWADKVGDEFAFERAGFVDCLKGKRVVIVEDLLTTGSSVAKVARLAEQHGAELVGVSAICNRGGVTAESLGVPRLEVLADVSFEAISPESCPLCENNTPIVEDIGHGDKYKADHPEYQGGYVKLLG